MRWIFLLAASAASVFGQLAAPNDSGVALGHVHLMVADPEAQKKLWVGVLGAEVTHAGTLELLKLPGIFVIVGKAQTAPTEGSEGSMVNHFGFLVKSYAETKAKLSAAGLDFATDNAATHQLMVNFPDKVKVEFTEDASLKVPLAMHHIHVSTLPCTTASPSPRPAALVVKNGSNTMDCVSRDMPRPVSETSSCT